MRKAIIIVALCATLFTAGLAHANGWIWRTVHMPEERLLIVGCKAEDDCRMDYRRVNGRGTWVLQRVDH